MVVCAAPADAVVETGLDLDVLLGPGETLADGPPFQGGVVGLAAYELSAQLEATAPQARGDWPDLILLRYPALLAFHAGQRRAVAIGRGPDARAAAASADFALSWLDLPRAPARRGVLAEVVSLATSDEQHARRWRERWSGSPRARSSRPIWRGPGAGGSSRTPGPSTCSRGWPGRARRATRRS